MPPSFLSPEQPAGDARKGRRPSCDAVCSGSASPWRALLLLGASASAIGWVGTALSLQSSEAQRSVPAITTSLNARDNRTASFGTRGRVLLPLQVQDNWWDFASDAVVLVVVGVAVLVVTFVVVVVVVPAEAAAFVGVSLFGCESRSGSDRPCGYLCWHSCRPWRCSVLLSVVLSRYCCCSCPSCFSRLKRRSAIFRCA